MKGWKLASTILALVLVLSLAGNVYLLINKPAEPVVPAAVEELNTLVEQDEPVAEEALPRQSITLSFTPGEEMGLEPGMADLFDVAALRFTTEKDVAGFALALLIGDTNAFAAAFRADEQGIYAQSKQAYDQSLFFSWDTFEEIMKGITDENAAKTLVDQYRQLFAGEAMGLFGSMYGFEASPSPEKAKEMLQDPAVRQMYLSIFGGDESMLTWMEGIYDNIVIAEGAFTAEDHDPATHKMEMVMTKDDIIAMLDTGYIRDQLKSQYTTSSWMTEEDVEERLNQEIESAKAELAKMNMLFPITYLFSGNDLVSVSMPMTMTITEREETATITIDYRRLTTDGNVRHSFLMFMETPVSAPITVEGVLVANATGRYDLDFSAKEKDKVQFSMKGFCEDNDGQINALLSILPEGGNNLAKGETELVIQLTGTKAKDASEYHVSFYTRKDIAEPMILAETDKPLFTLHINIECGDPDGAFDLINAATPENAVALFSLSPSEQAALFNDISANGLKAALGAASLLPPSVIQLVMPGGLPVAEEPVDETADAPVDEVVETVDTLDTVAPDE